MPIKYLNSIILSTLTGVLLGLLAPTHAAAQSIPSPYKFIEGRYSLGFFAGSFDMGRGELRLGPGKGPTAGILFGVEVRGPLAFEIGLSSIRANREIYRVTTTQQIEYVTDDVTDLLAAEGRVRFSLTGARTWHGFTPYVLGGGGVVRRIGGRAPEEAEFPPQQIFDFRTEFFLSGGTGVRWYPTDNFSLRAEGVFRSWILESPAAYALTTLPNGQSPLGEERVGGLTLLVGASLGF